MQTGEEHHLTQIEGWLAHLAFKRLTADTHQSAFRISAVIALIYSTSLLTDPEVFLMLLLNSIWRCIATVQQCNSVSLCNRRGGFQRRENRWLRMVLPVPVLLFLAAMAWLRSLATGDSRVWQMWENRWRIDGQLDEWLKKAGWGWRERGREEERESVGV